VLLLLQLIHTCDKSQKHAQKYTVLIHQLVLAKLVSGQQGSRQRPHAALLNKQVKLLECALQWTSKCNTTPTARQ
jgi:hypothetical protein